MVKQDAPAITQASLDGSDPLALETVDLFLAILGSEAGGNSLRVLAHGGVYLCGGILPRVSTGCTPCALQVMHICLVSAGFKAGLETHSKFLFMQIHITI